MYVDNLAAFVSSVLFNYTPEQAFNHVTRTKVRRWYTKDDIEDMRKLSKEYPLWQVAECYNMDKSTVSKLIRGIPFDNAKAKKLKEGQCV